VQRLAFVHTDDAEQSALEAAMQLPSLSEQAPSSLQREDARH
jgi:hypothetical protein